MNSQLVDLQVKNNYFDLRLADAQKLNALSPKLLDLFEQAWDQIEADPGRSIVVLSGLGRAFCVGADLKLLADLNSDPALAYVQRIGALFDRIRQSSKIVIAAVNGYALGGGAELMLSCDLVVASLDAVIGFPEVQLGLLAAAGGTTLLTAYVGLARAKQLLLTGERLTAEQALAWGLVTKLAESDVLAESIGLADQLAVYPALALASIKSIVKRGADLWQSIRTFELDCFRACFKDPQAIQLRSRFAGKK